MNERRYHTLRYDTPAELADLLESLARQVRYEQDQRMTRYTKISIDTEYTNGYRVELAYNYPPVSVDDNGIAHSTEHNTAIADRYMPRLPPEPESDSVPF